MGMDLNWKPPCSCWRIGSGRSFSGGGKLRPIKASNLYRSVILYFYTMSVIEKPKKLWYKFLKEGLQAIKSKRASAIQGQCHKTCHIKFKFFNWPFNSWSGQSKDIRKKTYLQSWTKSVKNFTLCYARGTHPVNLASWWPLPPPLPDQCC